MATGFSRSITGGSDSFKGSFTFGSEEIFDFICNPCENRDNSKVEAEFYCSVCDDYICQPCRKVHNSFKGNRNHPIYGRDQMDKWGVQVQSAMLPTEVCPDHAEESLKMVCLNHKMLCCTVCAALHHRACPEMVYVPKIAKGITKSEDLSIVSHTIDQCIQNIDEMIKSDKKTQTSLHKSKVDYLDDIKEIRRQVNNLFKVLEFNTVNEMYIFHTNKKDLLQQHLNSLKDSKDKLVKLQTAIQHLSAHNESQLFIEMFKANEQLPDFQHNLQKLSRIPQTTSFYLNQNAKLQQFLATIQNIGELIGDTAVIKINLPNITPLPLLQLAQPSSSVEETYDIASNAPKQQSNTISRSSPVIAAIPTFSVKKQNHPQPQNQEQQQQLYSALNGHAINVRMASAKMCCDVNGICQMPNGDVLLTDTTNIKVKRLNTNYKPKRSLDLPQSPTAICCLCDSEAAVTDANKTIRFLFITSSTMSLKRSLKLDHECYGIVHHNGRLFVSNENDKVYIYTASGIRLKTIQTDNNGVNIFSDTCHICASPDGRNIYVADFDKGLVILDGNGSHISTYSSRDLRGACGVCVDNQGRVLVCGYYSSNVLQLKVGGRLVGNVVHSREDSGHPQSICIDTHNSTLIIGKRGMDSIRVFDLK